MKFFYSGIALLVIALLSACASGDKKADVTTTTDGPNVIIDSTGLKNSVANNNSMPLNANQPNVQTLVNNTGQPQTVTIPAQNVQTTTVSSQQIQQQIQQQMQQQQAAKPQQISVGQPQQIQTTQQSAHPQFTTEEFKRMQDDAKKRGVALNPAHGQPGHRCDIYVGQPLDSKPVAGLAPAAQPTTVSTTPAAPQTVVAAPQPVKTEPGMNPPHGQPGHRCDIEVGKPLNSKPLPTATPTATAIDSAKGGQ